MKMKMYEVYENTKYFKVIFTDVIFNFKIEIKRKIKISKLLSWFLKLSRIMTQPYDDAFNIKGNK